jgi:hypothetical protein
MGYKLADGSDSSDYVVGDEFEVVLNEKTPSCFRHDMVKFIEDDGSDAPFFNNATRGNGAVVCEWDEIKPTAETLRKVSERKNVTENTPEKPDKREQPTEFARIVDWRNEEVLGSDVVCFMSTSKNQSFDDLKSGGDSLVNAGNIQVIRINFDALPKQRTMTREEVEKEFGVRVVD